MNFYLLTNISSFPFWYFSITTNSLRYIIPIVINCNVIR